MNQTLLVTLLVSGISFGTPLLLAGIGELLAELSGVLNLGLEGIMLVGAVSAFWVSQVMSGPIVIVLVVSMATAGLSGAALAGLHSILVIRLGASQVVSGLAITILGGAAGLSSYLGWVGHLTGQAGRHSFSQINVFGLQDLPVIGPIVFHQDAMVYASWLLVVCVMIYIYRTRWGRELQAVGNQPHAADSCGVNVSAVRYFHTVAGGVLAGMGGAYFSLGISTSWSAGMTAGAGWIALGLVIVSFWRPILLLLGAYGFGILTTLGFDLQTRGVHVAPELFAALPYLAAVVVLSLVSNASVNRNFGAPSALGIPYRREDQ